MALKLRGRYELDAPQQEVWETILQPDVLRECIPGCNALDADGETCYRAIVATKVGPIRATFKGRVELSEMDPPRSMLLSGGGEGGLAGSAKGSARITLSQGAGPAMTILEYEGDVAIAGKLAQLGSRLIDSVSRKLADQFFESLTARFDHANRQSA